MDEPYVFPSQVKQVFYYQDPTEMGWYVILRNTLIHLIDIKDGSSDAIETRSETFPFVAQNLDKSSTSSQFQWVLEDIYEMGMKIHII